MASIYYYHYHHESGHDYIKHDIANGSNLPYLGIELEVDKGGCSDRAATAFDEKFTVHNDPEWLMFENDGSLDNGFEIITNPGTLAFHKALRQSYEDGFRTLVRMGFRSFNTNTCGMHIHVNRDFFGNNVNAQNNNIEKIIAISEKFYDELLTFSRRDMDDADSWAKKWEDDPHEIIEDMEAEELDTRYACVNLCPSCTIEFRIFKGTLNPKSFFASLELVNNICVWAMNHSLADVDTMEWTDLIHGDEIEDFWERVKNRVVH